MVDLMCGQDLAKLGIRTWEGGVNITAFLDHLEACEKCERFKGELIQRLNNLIGAEE